MCDLKNQEEMAKIAVVTGSNKGIGFACVRALCKQLGADSVVYLTARNHELGQKAVVDLEKEGLKPRFHQLDISNKESVVALRDHLEEVHGGLDILINNAAISFKADSTAPPAEQTRVTNSINYFGTALVFDILSPILRPHARVVNVAGRMGQHAYNRLGDNLKNDFKSATSVSDIDKLVQRFIDLTASGEAEKHGYTPGSNLGFSKLALIAVTRMQAKEIRKDSSRPDINVYSCCPGYVATEMSNNKGPKTPDEGADTLVWLALQPQGKSEGNGEFFFDRKAARVLV